MEYNAIFLYIVRNAVGEPKVTPSEYLFSPINSANLNVQLLSLPQGNAQHQGSSPTDDLFIFSTSQSTSPSTIHRQTV